MNHLVKWPVPPAQMIGWSLDQEPLGQVEQNSEQSTYTSVLGSTWLSGFLDWINMKPFPPSQYTPWILNSTHTPGTWPHICTFTLFQVVYTSGLSYTIPGPAINTNCLSSSPDPVGLPPQGHRRPMEWGVYVWNVPLQPLPSDSNTLREGVRQGPGRETDEWSGLEVQAWFRIAQTYYCHKGSLQWVTGWLKLSVILRLFPILFSLV